MLVRPAPRHDKQFLNFAMRVVSPVRHRNQTLFNWWIVDWRVCFWWSWWQSAVSNYRNINADDLTPTLTPRVSYDLQQDVKCHSCIRMRTRGPSWHCVRQWQKSQVTAARCDCQQFSLWFLVLSRMLGIVLLCLPLPQDCQWHVTPTGTCDRQSLSLWYIFPAQLLSMFVSNTTDVENTQSYLAEPVLYLFRCEDL